MFGVVWWQFFDPRDSDTLDRFPDCELTIFSGDDGVCLRPDQVKNLDWSSVETCQQKGKVITCNPTVYPRIFSSSPEKCAKLFDSSWSAWVDYVEKKQSDVVQSEPPSKQAIISESEFFAEFRETDCRFRVGSWAYLTENEDMVWDGMPWPDLKTYPHEHLNHNEVMRLEVFPKSSPLKGNHYLHQINYGEYQYLWDAINHGTTIISYDQADEFLKMFADKSGKFEMNMQDGTKQIWAITYGEKHLREDQHMVEAIVFASDIPGDAPNMPYVEIPQEMKPLIDPLTDKDKQFRYQEISHEDAEKIFDMLDKNGIMYTMDGEKLFLKYFGPLSSSSTDTIQ